MGRYYWVGDGGGPCRVESYGGLVATEGLLGAQGRQTSQRGGGGSIPYS